ncbi:MAG: two-component regulator propeller domain-containing protein [Chitinophagaceae bacterium]
MLSLRELNGQNVAFDHFTVENGLSSNAVLAVAQDGDGFMWFGTQTGLNRYDGARVRVYKNDLKDSFSITGNNIQALLCDSRKILWIASSTGLDRYNRAHDNFEKVRLPAKGFYMISCLYEDREARLWVGTSAGLFMITNVRQNTIQAFHAAENGKGIAGENVHSICEDSKGNIWVGTLTGLTRMQWNNGVPSFQSFRHEAGNPNSISSNSIMAIAEDSLHHLWFGTQNDGLNGYDPAKEIFTRYAYGANTTTGLINNNIRTILPVRNGKLWIGTQEGLSIMDPATRSFASYQHDAGNKKSLSQNSIYSLYEDANGSVWAGTYFGGVNTSYPYTTYFNVFQNNEHRSSLSNNVVSSIIEDEQHNLWIGTEGGGLNCFNRTTGVFTAYKNQPGNPASIGSNLVKVVYKDSDGNIWCGTHGGGLNVLDRRTGKFIRYLYEPNVPQIMVTEVTSLLDDGSGRLWVVTNVGFKVFRRKGTILTPLDLHEEIGNFPALQGRVLYKDSKQNNWLGTMSGLYLLEAHSFKTVNASFRINAICEGADGNLWLGLNYGGLAKYNVATQQYTVYTDKDGLTNSNIIGVLEDDDRNLWLSTDNGLIKFDPRQKTVLTYTVSDGLAGNEFNYNSYLRDSKGEFFFGGLNGFTAFYPDKIEANQYAAPVAFTGLRLFNKPVTLNDESALLKADINTVKKIVFKYNQDVFTIEFALLNYIKSNKNKYAYYLKGFDKNWNEVTVPSATYTNLPFGTYTFYVKGANNDGVWSKPIELTITLLPPFWLTWWAYCIYGIAFAAIVFLITRYFFLNALLKKEDELHQVKLNFFTNISHEIRTHLTLIMTPVDRVLETKEKSGFEYQLLSQVKTNANRLLKLVSELMDFRKAETDHLQLQVGRINIVPFLQDIYDSFRELSQTKRIRTSFIHNAENIPIYLDSEQMEKVFFNLLMNAFKFTEAGGQISLGIEQQEGKVLVRVKDNGKGIAPEYLDKLFTNFFQVADHGLQNTGYGIGLALSKHIVILHKGSITVESEPAMPGKEGYTCFTVTLLQGNSHFAEDANVRFAVAQENTALFNDEIRKGEAVSPAAITHTDKQLTLLVAEDNPELRALVVQTFQAQYHIIECENGREGWEAAIAQIPDIVVSDVMMPDMDGLTFCRQLKTDERTSHIPVILLTAKSAQGDLVKGLETGADVYITKPFSTRALELNVRNLLLSREKIRVQFSRLLQQQPVPGEKLSVVEEESYVNNVDKEFLERVIELVEEHMDDPDFGVDKLSRKVALSQPILYRKIKAVTNMSVNEFVKSLRLKKAAQLLQQRNMTVYEVAYAVGYVDRKYFSREFKKQFGKTPSEYVESATA